MSSDSLTFFNGVKSTGVQVMYGRGKNGIVFDFGIPHKGLIDASNVIAYDPIRLFPGRGARQLLLGKMAPPIPELYDAGQIDAALTERVAELWDNKVFPQYDNLHIYINHAHQDHMAILPFAREGINVYMSRDTYSLYRGIVASGGYADTKGNMVPLDNMSKVDFGDFTMTTIAMDHDAEGAMALLLESPDFKIAYTGDWTRYGYHPERIDRFIDFCSSKQIDLLITEATRPKPAKPLNSEKEVVEQYADILKGAEGIVYLQPLPRNVKRGANFIHEAVKAGRQVVLDYSLAVLWHQTMIKDAFHSLTNHPVRSVMDSIRVLDVTAPAGVTLPFPAITVDDMIRRKTQIVYMLTYPSLPVLLELEMMGEGCGKSQYILTNLPMWPDQQSYLNKYVEKFGIDFHRIGTSGHAAAEAITDMIQRIAPKAVIPMHGPNPRALDTGGIPAY